MNAIAVLEKQLAPLAPRFAEVLPPNVKPDRLIRTVVVSVERNPTLLECNRQSLFNAAMSAAILGLEVDGVTGQAFLIPFKNRAQLVVGYKGFNTIAARAGLTISGACVREGDVFEYELGSNAFVRHVPMLNNEGRIVAAWACATHASRPPVVSVLGIAELMAVKAKSPGARKTDSPWNDPAIGFPAMAETTAKRRLARSLPQTMMQAAARLDEAFDEQGKTGYISPDRGVVVEGELIEAAGTPTAAELSTGAIDPLPVESKPAVVLNRTATAGDLLLQNEARKQARNGRAAFEYYWNNLSKADRVTLEAIGPELRKLMDNATAFEPEG